MTPTLYQITLSVTYDYASAFAECLEPHLDSVAWTAQEGTLMTEIIGFSNQLPNKDAIHLALSSTAEAFDTVVPRFKMSKIRNRNWVLDNIKKFPPLTIGQFFVHGNEVEKPIPVVREFLQSLWLNVGVFQLLQQTLTLYQRKFAG